MLNYLMPNTTKKAVVEVGSSNTKTLLYENGKFTEQPEIRIEVYSSYNKHGDISSEDVSKISEHVLALLNDGFQVKIVGTSVFRSLNEEQRQKFLKTFKAKTGIDFKIVSPNEEAELTVKGVIRKGYKGRLGIVVGGGKSTETYVVENGEIIEKHHDSYGAWNVIEKFPSINDFRTNLDLEEVEQFIVGMSSTIENKCDVLVIAGGDHLSWAIKAGYDVLLNNDICEDEMQPYKVSIADNKAVTLRFIKHDDLESYYKRFPAHTPAWWDGTRCMRMCVNASAKMIGAKWIIPTKINMCLGIIAEWQD